jgi:phasin family protein
MHSLIAGGLPFAFSDVTRAWLGFQLPSRNIEALREAHQKNAAALTNANRAILDGLNTVAQHQAEFIQSRMDDYRKVTTEVLASTSIQEGAAKQADTNGHVYRSSVGHTRQLLDIAVGANVSAVDILNTRVAEAFDELKSVFAPAAGSSGSQTEMLGEQTANSEPADRKENAKVQPADKTPRRKRAKSAAKGARSRASRR